MKVSNKNMHVDYHKVDCMCNLILVQCQFSRLFPTVLVWKGRNSIGCCDFKNSSLQAQEPFWFVSFFLYFTHVYTYETLTAMHSQLEEAIE